VKIVSAPLLALFNSAEFFDKCDLYTITLQDGTVVRTTDADRSLTWSGNVFASCSPAIKRTKVRLAIGVQVDTMSLDLQTTTLTVNGFTYNNAARQGMFDGATVLVETAYITNWPTIIGVLHAFFGLVSEIEPGRSGVKMTVKSALELLSQPFPRNVYQSTCLHTLYNTGCSLTKGSFTAAGTVSGTPTLTGISSSLAQPVGYFDQGVLTFTSGPNSGLKRTVKGYTTGSFTFANPLPVLPAAGNTFSVFAGCDKTKSTCGAKFSNLTNFRGFPYIPTPETTY
jgi:uncharacterized phage protein (TIGR02218 family)